MVFTKDTFYSTKPDHKNSGRFAILGGTATATYIYPTDFPKTVSTGPTGPPRKTFCQGFAGMIPKDVHRSTPLELIELEQ